LNAQHGRGNNKAVKIAELFVALGFEVTGEDALDTADKGLRKAEGSAVKLLAILTGINAAFYAMMHAATGAAAGLEKFESLTGLSGQKLRMWQQDAAAFNVDAKDVEGSLKAIQRAQTDIMLGKGDVAPWQMLGVDPTQKDTFKTVVQLSQQLKKFDPQFARAFAEGIGASEDFIFYLREATPEALKLREALFLSGQEQDNLFKAGGAWKSLLFSLAQARDKFMAAFAPTLEKVLKVLTFIVDIGTRFLTWLNNGSALANILRFHLVLVAAALTVVTIALAAFLAVLTTASAIVSVMNSALWAMALKALPALATAFTVVTGALSAAATAAAAFAVALVPVLVAAAPLLLVIGLIAAAIGALVLMVDDFWTAIDGGDSVFDWSASIKAVDALASAIEWLISVWEKLNGVQKGGLKMLGGFATGNLPKMWEGLKEMAGGAKEEAGNAFAPTPQQEERESREPQQMDTGISFLNELMRVGKPSEPTPETVGGLMRESAVPPVTNVGGQTINQENNVNIQVPGGDSPSETAKETYSLFDREVNNAFRQLPNLSY